MKFYKLRYNQHIYVAALSLVQTSIVSLLPAVRYLLTNDHEGRGMGRQQPDIFKYSRIPRGYLSVLMHRTRRVCLRKRLR